MANGLQKLFPAMGIAGDGDEDQAAKLKKILEGINKGTEVEIAAPVAAPSSPTFAGEGPKLDGGYSEEWLAKNNPYSLENGGPGNSFAKWTPRGEKLSHNNVLEQLMGNTGRKARTQPTISDPLQGGYGDAALRPGANFAGDERERQMVASASEDETNRILGRAGEIATAGPIAGEYQPMDTGNMIGGRNPGAANTQVYEDALLPGQTAPAPAYKQPQTSNETSDRLNRINSGELDKELGIKKRSLASRLFRGLGRGWQNWGKEDGAFGLFDMFGEGVQSAASSKHDIEAQRQGKQRPLFRQLGQQQQQEAFNAKQATELAQAANYGNQINVRTAGEIRAQNKDHLDRTKVTQKISNGFYYDVDAQGKWTPHIDPVTKKQRVEGEDLLVGRTLKDGTPIWTKGSKAYSDEVAADLNQARMDFDAAKINQADLDRYEGEVTDWATKSSAWEEDKVRKPILEGQALQNDAAGYDEQAAKTTDKDKKAEWQAKAVEARSKGNALVAQGNEARGKGPKKPTRPAANLTAPNLNVGQHSEATIRAGLVARGLKGKELEAKMAEARAAGVIK